MVFKLSKKGHILQFCDDLSKKTKSIKVIYIDASDGIVMHFEQMVLLIMLLCYDLLF